jgi:TatD DNase family protein
MSEEHPPLRFTDNHCHLYDPRVPEGTPGLVAAARAAGVHRMITVGCDAETSRAAIAIAQDYEDIWATVGLHPHEARHGVSTIVDLIGEPKVVAIGECGLDYFYDHSARDEQKHAFAEQIRLAHEHDLPLVIHTRDAWDETFEILDSEGIPANTIFHCFTGGPADAEACLERGAFLSFSGIVTFKNAEPLREAARLCPLDRMLIETDAPYLAPIPHRGRPNQPSWVTHVAEALAATTNRTLREIAEATDHSAVIAFRLPLP